MKVSRRSALKGALISLGNFLTGCGGGGGGAAEPSPGNQLLPATAVTLTGPSTGPSGAASANFVVGVTPLAGVIADAITVTPSDNAGGGVFTPSSVTLTSSLPTGAFTYTPASSGAKTISVGNNRALGNPTALSFDATTVATTLLALGFDAETPEQVSIHCPTSRPVLDGTTVNVRYRSSGTDDWRVAHPLLHVDPKLVPTGSPSPVVESFSGVIFDLQPGTGYEIELSVQVPSEPVLTLTGTRATRALPLPAGLATVRASPTSDLQAIVNTLTAGSVLELDVGTYTLNTGVGLLLNLQGTATRPIYIRGVSRTGVILHNPSDTVIKFMTAANVVLENLTIRGSGKDSGVEASSSGVTFHAVPTPQTNITIRYVTFTGVDKGIKSWTRLLGCLVYECDFKGNNSWDKAYAINPASDAPNYTWNDDGICIPGDGNAAWNNTLHGFGDALAVVDGVTSAAVFFYRNHVPLTCNNACAGDYSTRNMGFYDNYISNCGTLLSLDPLWGGPFFCFRNTAINTIRSPFKLTFQSCGMLIYNNTIVRTDGTSVAGMYVPDNGAQRKVSYRNNLLVYRGVTGSTLRIEANVDKIDFTHNAWFPDSSFDWTNAGGSFNSLSAARAGLPNRSPLFASAQRHFQDAIVTSNPWTNTVSLGADHTAEYIGMQRLELLATSTARATGVVIPGITDGFSGAAPDRGALLAGRPVVSVGSTSAGTGPETWTKNVAVGAWGVIPGNKLADVNPDNDPAYNPNFPARAPWRQIGSQLGVMAAWCGMAFDPVAGRGWIPNGEGHNDGWANTVYKWDLDRAVPGWEMVRPPSAVSNYADGRVDTGVYSDGRPRALHTYNYTEYIPGIGPAVCNEIALSNTGGSGPGRLYLVNESTGEATFRAASTPANGSGAASCHDPYRGVVWMRVNGTQPMRYWRPDTNIWSTFGSNQGWNGSCSLCYLPKHDCILIGNGDEELLQTVTGGFCVFDCVTGTYHFPVFRGAPTTLNMGLPGGLWPGKCQPSWDARRGCAYAWDQDRGSTTSVLRLTPGANPRTDEWTIDTVPLSAGNAVVPSAAQPAGTYGRAFYWAAQDVLVVVNRVNEPGYFFRLG
jgi:hypothetical protein